MRKVVVTGMGAVTPFGAGVETLWRNALEGRNGISAVDFLDLRGELVKIAGCPPKLDPVRCEAEYRKVLDIASGDPHAHHYMLAVAEAVAQSGIDFRSMPDTSRVGCYVADRTLGPSHFVDQYAGYLVRSMERGELDDVRLFELLRSEGLERGALVRDQDSVNHLASRGLGITGPQVSIGTACASGTNAIGEAMLKIASGKLDVAIAGGAFAPDLSGMIGFTLIGALTTNPDPDKACSPFDARRSGFVMGSGCGILVLESLEGALRRGAEILAEVSGYGSLSDAFRATDPDPNAEGAVRTIRSALGYAGIDPRQVSYVNAHGTSTLMNDRSETIALKRVLGAHSATVPVSSTKSMIGHGIMAAGAIEAIVSVKSILTGMVHPTRNYEHRDPELDLDYVPGEARRVDVEHVLSNSFGFGGQNASLVLSKFKGGRP